MNDNRCAHLGISDSDLQKFHNYTLEDYLEDLNTVGLAQTWEHICAYLRENGENDGILNIDEFPQLYEIGLATVDKFSKKKSGQYCTPDDVAAVMSRWLRDCEGENVCDVACGTGKLILTYLDILGYDSAKELIEDGKIYLYDNDPVALNICKTAICVRYQIADHSVIHDFCCDFLSSAVHLPDNSKVISNPPYAAIQAPGNDWNMTDVLTDTKELYSAFMEKIVLDADASVVITPFSFISGSKFYSLRKTMCENAGGFIVAFDNVPGNIFHGRKHGIFNSNKANSVRAAITVCHRHTEVKGFRVSPLLRFRTEERSRLLQNSILENELAEEVQVVDSGNTAFRKIQKGLETVYQRWVSRSDCQVCDLISETETPYFIDMPNTCRYFTAASTEKLSRVGSITFFVKSRQAHDFLYCLLNSSFAYWWWRVFDGGITYPVSLLRSMPVPFNRLTVEDLEFFSRMKEEMCRVQNDFRIVKMNAGTAQENIKFPDTYRDRINNRILKILGIDETAQVFEKVHSNSFFEEKTDGKERFFEL